MTKSVIRKYQTQQRQYHSQFLKKQVRKVVASMGKGFTDEEFIEAFKQTFPYEWKRMETWCNEYIRRDQDWLKAKGEKVYDAVDVSTYILRYSSSAIEKKRQQQLMDDGSDEPKVDASPNKRSISKLRKFNEKQETALRLRQTSSPKYVDYYCRTYYEYRKRYPEDIDSRYLILHEASKYRCSSSVRLLSQVAACERNNSLRWYAFHALQQMGVQDAKVGRARKGNKRPLDSIRYNAIDSPQELLQRIYTSPIEKMKNYDLFISHSYKDRDALIRIKALLNGSNLNVYLDWVNDKDELLREKTCAETAAVITERIRNSKAILYIHTEESINSRWTPWEIGFAHALGKKICVYSPDETVEKPEFIQLYDTAVLEGDGLLVKADGSAIKITDWIKM